MSDSLHDRVFSEYRHKKIGSAGCCRECGKTPGISRPASYWHIGVEYERSKPRILFVGKTMTDLEDANTLYGVLDGSQHGRCFLREGFSAFWCRTKEIAAEFFHEPGDTAIERIAISNMVKCSNSHRDDKTTPAMKMNCMVTLGAFPAELAILHPTLVVCYAGDDYDVPIMGALALLAGQQGWTLQQRTNANTRFPGRGRTKKLWKWVIELQSSGRPVMRFLTTSHPQGKAQDHFVHSIANWLRENEALGGGDSRNGQVRRVTTTSPAHPI